MPLPEAGHPWAPRWFRTFVDVRHTQRAQGIGTLMGRLGPIWALPGNWALAAQFIPILDQPLVGSFAQEYRTDLEAFRGDRLGPWGLFQRYRVEARALPIGLRPRFRALTRLAWQPEGPLQSGPFLMQEALYEPTAGGYNQQRAMAGWSWFLAKDLRLDLMYMARPRLAGAEWAVDHAVVSNLLYTPAHLPVDALP